MAYTPMTLKDWITAHPDYNTYTGIVAGKPLLYQTPSSGTDPVNTDVAWYVWDFISEFPDLSQSPTTVDISTTGSISRKLIPGVPDAPDAADATVNLGQNTDATIDAILGIVAANQAAITANKPFYFAHFMGLGVKSEIYAGSVTWNSGVSGAFGDALSTTVGITPNLGAYHKFEVITATT